MAGSPAPGTNWFVKYVWTPSTIPVAVADTPYLFLEAVLEAALRVVEPFGSYIGGEPKPGHLFVFYFGTARNQCFGWVSGSIANREEFNDENFEKFSKKNKSKKGFIEAAILAKEGREDPAVVVANTMKLQEDMAAAAAEKEKKAAAKAAKTAAAKASTGDDDDEEEDDDEESDEDADDEAILASLETDYESEEDEALPKKRKAAPKKRKAPSKMKPAADDTPTAAAAAATAAVAASSAPTEAGAVAVATEEAPAEADADADAAAQAAAAEAQKLAAQKLAAEKAELQRIKAEKKEQKKREKKEQKKREKKEQKKREAEFVADIEKIAAGPVAAGLTQLHGKLQQTLSTDGRSLNGALASLTAMSTMTVVAKDLEPNTALIKALKKVKKLTPAEGDDVDVVNQIKVLANNVYVTWKNLFTTAAPAAAEDAPAAP
eukprot:gene4109-11876_t